MGGAAGVALNLASFCRIILSTADKVLGILVGVCTVTKLLKLIEVLPFCPLFVVINITPFVALAP